MKSEILQLSANPRSGRGKMAPFSSANLCARRSDSSNGQGTCDRKVSANETAYVLT
jgi:hypothetical protein